MFDLKTPSPNPLIQLIQATIGLSMMVGGLALAAAILFFGSAILVGLFRSIFDLWPS